MAWNVFKIDSSKIGFYQNFLIYCDKFDNKIIYCLSRFRAGNFSPAPTSRLVATCDDIWYSFKNFLSYIRRYVVLSQFFED